MCEVGETGNSALGLRCLVDTQGKESGWRLAIQVLCSGESFGLEVYIPRGRYKVGVWNHRQWMRSHGE